MHDSHRVGPEALAGTNSRSGVALVTVLMILSVLLVLAVGAMALTRTNLLIAQNQVSNTIARSNAEAGLDATILALSAAFRESGVIPDASSFEPPVAAISDGTIDYELQSMVVNGDLVSIRVTGDGPRNAAYESEALIEFSGTSSSGPTPFSGAIIACDGLALTGGGKIDAFDSRVAGYDQNNPLWSTSIRTTSDKADITLTGGTYVYGDLNATGGATVTAGASVYGNINANGDVHISSAGNFGGDIRTTGDMRFSNTAKVSGSVSSNGEMRFDNGAQVAGNAHSGADMVFTNTGANIKGDATVGGTYRPTQWGTHVEGSVINAQPVPNHPVPSDVCDPLGIDFVAGEVAQQLVGVASPTIKTGWPKDDWAFTPSGVVSFDKTWKIDRWVNEADAHQVDVLGSSTSVIRTGDFNLNNGVVTISGGDVTLFIDGNFNAATGGGKMVIERGSSLTVFVTGKTKLGSSFAIEDEFGRRVTGTVAETGTPTFSIFSSYDAPVVRSRFNQTAGVIIEGGADVPVNVYAPNTGVDIRAGGNLFGSVRGREIQVPGGAGIHYDLALGEVELGTAGPGQSQPTVRVISRR